MYTLPIFSGLIGLAALLCLSTCNVKTESRDEPFLFDVAKGHRVHLKTDDPTIKDVVAAFEQRLIAIPREDRTGTYVNLRRDDGTEEEGPTDKDEFVKPSPTPWGPDGSMHNTQKISLANNGDVNAIMSSFDFGSMARTTPTPTPAP